MSKVHGVMSEPELAALLRVGEFVEREMMDRFGGDATRAAVAEIVELGRNRRSWIAFCISVEHARAVRHELRRHGIAAETVTAESRNRATASMTAA